MDLSELELNKEVDTIKESPESKKQQKSSKKIQAVVRRKSSKFKQMFDLSFLSQEKDQKDTSTSSKTSITSIEAVERATEKLVRQVSNISTISLSRNKETLSRTGSGAGSNIENDYHTAFHNPNYTNVEEIELRLKYFDLYGFPIHHEFLEKDYRAEDDGTPFYPRLTLFRRRKNFEIDLKGPNRTR